MTEQVFSTLFIELDALLDSRASTLFRLNNNFFSTVDPKVYFKRISDEFGVEGYKELYEKRDRETLKNMLVTDIGGLLIEFCERTLENAYTSPFHYSPKIVINIHPYKLEESEITNIISGVRGLTNGMCDIEAVDMSYEQITPVFVKSKLSILILYKYIDWLEIHSANELFKKTTCPEVTLFGPMISFIPLDVNNLSQENPFDAMMKLASPIINLKLLPIENFCFSRLHLNNKK